MSTEYDTPSTWLHDTEPTYPRDDSSATGAEYGRKPTGLVEVDTSEGVYGRQDREDRKDRNTLQSVTSKSSINETLYIVAGALSLFAIIIGIILSIFRKFNRTLRSIVNTTENIQRGLNNTCDRSRGDVILHEINRPGSLLNLAPPTASSTPNKDCSSIAVVPSTSCMKCQTPPKTPYTPPVKAPVPPPVRGPVRPPVPPPPIQNTNRTLNNTVQMEETQVITSVIHVTENETVKENLSQSEQPVYENSHIEQSIYENVEIHVPVANDEPMDVPIKNRLRVHKPVHRDCC